MIERVYISYSTSEIIIYSFWKSFFRMCGIWLVEEEIQRDGCNIFEDAPHLLLLGKKDDCYILDEERNNCVYLVGKDSALAEKNDRKDIVKIDEEDKNKEIFSLVLEKLLGKRAECSKLQELLEAFMEERLWGISWSYNEMAFQENKSYDDYINFACDKALERIRGEQEWHHRFLKLYCEYIKYGISADSLLSRSKECIRLLLDCERLAEPYGWCTQLCVIAGKICGLSQLERRYKLNYYRSIEKRDRNAEILYDIGHIYEKILGDSDSAVNYYKQSYEQNQEYFRAGYKLAVNMELKGKWMEAFSMYEKIRALLKRVDLDDAISIKEIEYRCKSCKRLIQICERYVAGDDLIKDYNDEIIEMSGQVQNGNVFKNLFRHMFGEDEKSLKSQILEAVHKKILFECDI